MEAIATIGLLSNILTFVDLGVKVVSKSREIRKSTNGATGENNTLELVTNELLVLRTKIDLKAPALSTAPQGDEGLHRLLDEARAVGEVLLQRLNNVKGTGPSRKWKSVRQALKWVYSRDEIQALAARLSSVRDQIQTHLLVLQQ